MRSQHAAYVFAALSLGLGLGFWHLGNENSRLDRLVRASQAEALEARGYIETLQDKLRNEKRAHQIAEATKSIAETSERSAREKLSRETKAREAAEKIEATASRQLLEARMAFADEVNARKAAEAARSETENALALMKARLAEEADARKSAEEQLANAEEQVLLLSARALKEMTAREEAQAAKTSADKEISALKDELRAASAEARTGANTMYPLPASLDTTGLDGLSDDAAAVASKARANDPNGLWHPTLAIQ
jgi:hypothetical protein